MIPLFSAWRKIESRITGRPILLFLDYDGTLVPIKKRPGLAVLSMRRRRLLRNLASEPHIRIAVVSGRALSQVKRLVGLSNVVYVGNHGLEIEGPNLRWVDARARPLLDHARLRKRLRTAFRDLPGILVEDKGLSASVHYRLATPAARRAAGMRLRRLIGDELGRTVVIRSGKKVWELRPAIPVNKGTAVAALLKTEYDDSGAVPIYIGDDKTDEDALRLIRRKGIAIKVLSAENAKDKSHARYYLRSTDEVYRFLSRLLAIAPPRSGELDMSFPHLQVFGSLE